jgi:hypothetical protein
MANEIYDSTWWGNTIDTASSIGTSTEMIQGQFNMLTSNQPNLVTNGDFSNGSTGWLNVGQQNANNTNTFSNGKVILVNDGTGSGISQPNILEIGKTYQVEIVVSEIVGNGFKIYTGTDYSITNTGTFTLQVTSTTNNLFYLYRNQTNPQAINGATIDNVSIKEVRATTIEASKCLADAIHRIGIQDIQN